MQGCIFRVDRQNSQNVVSYVYKFENDYSDEEKVNKYYPNTWYDFYVDTDAEIFEEIYKESEDLDYKMVIVKSDYSDESNALDEILESDEFEQFMSENVTPYTYYVRLKPENYGNRLGLALSSFICADFRSQDDNGDSWTYDSSVPKIYLYQGCKSCTSGPNPAIFVATEINNPQTLTVQELTAAINEKLKYS